MVSIAAFHPPPRKKIGLIGGMGSLATIQTYRKIMYLAQHNQSAFSPHLIINNLPQENIFDQPEECLVTMICHAIEDLSKAGVSVVGMSCNTAHMYLNSINAEAERRQVRFVNLIDCVITQCKQNGYSKIGILATPKGCEIYRQAIHAQQMLSLIPTPLQQLEINHIIRAVLAGPIQREHRSKLEQISDQMRANGCDTILLGCTELPLVFGESTPTDFTCSISILAESLLEAVTPSH